MLRRHPRQTRPFRLHAFVEIKQLHPRLIRNLLRRERHLSQLLQPLRHRHGLDVLLGVEGLHGRNELLPLHGVRVDEVDYVTEFGLCCTVASTGVDGLDDGAGCGVHRHPIDAVLVPERFKGLAQRLGRLYNGR